MEKEEILKRVVTEMTECALSDRRENCPDEEKCLYREIGELSKMRGQILEKYTQEERQILESYVVKTNIMAEHECEVLYIQGAKDCVGLLKKLGVL